MRAPPLFYAVFAAAFATGTLLALGNSGLGGTPVHALAKPARTAKSFKAVVTTTPKVLSTYAPITGTDYGSCSNTLTVRSGLPVGTLTRGQAVDAGGFTFANSTITLCSDPAACDVRTWVRDVPADQIVLVASSAPDGGVDVYVEAFGGCQ